MTFSIRDLNAGYRRSMVLHDVHVGAIEPGSFVGLIGPNASGKSTLFKTIAGLLKPRDGTILLDGRDLSRARRAERARCVAYMAQISSTNAVLTVFESVLLALKQTTGWRVDRNDLDQIAETLASLGLTPLADRGVSQLSGGQAQMVAVAQNVVRDPELVLLDEPTSALDLHNQLSILAMVRDIMRQRRRIVIAALHDLNLAAQFCDRLILMRGGRIVADGTPHHVLSRDALGEAYQVVASVETTRRGTLYVDARLPA